MGSRCAVVSCHVEKPLDDAVWHVYSRLLARRPGGFEIASVMRVPDREAGESEALWLARARIASAHGPLGHHTHWGGAGHARPTGGPPAERVRREAEWLHEHGLRPRLFCGGGWYMDGAVASALVELGYADCTATAFRPGYLPAGAPRWSLAEPARVRVAGGVLPELPSTHSLGMAARGVLGRLPPFVHVYFHDTDLLDGRRRRALELTLVVLARRRRPERVDRVETLVDADLSTVASKQ